MSKEKIDFGFKQVDKEQKAAMVYDVFASVASKYDIMNDVMSAGMHRIWKDKFVNIADVADGCKLLDLAGGTGDISFRFLRNAKRNDIDIHATITDINPNMLEQGKQRAIDNNILHNVDWNIVNAEKIPYADASFDVCTIAFGIRNVTNRQKALSEIYRVLKSGGQFLCLEFSHVENPAMGKLYDLFSTNIIPIMGQIIADDRESYQYLVESIKQFPNRDEFGKMIEEAGFSRVKHEILSKGVVAIHRGWKI